MDTNPKSQKAENLIHNYLRYKEISIKKNSYEDILMLPGHRIEGVKVQNSNISDPTFKLVIKLLEKEAMIKMSLEAMKIVEKGFIKTVEMAPTKIRKEIGYALLLKEVYKKGSFTEEIFSMKTLYKYRKLWIANVEGYLRN